MGNITKIKYKLSSLREEKNKTFRGDYVLNRNLCIRYNELVGQLKLILKMLIAGRPYKDLISSVDLVSWGHVRNQKEFSRRLKELEKEIEEGKYDNANT